MKKLIFTLIAIFALGFTICAINTSEHEKEKTIITKVVYEYLYETSIYHEIYTFEDSDIIVSANPIKVINYHGTFHHGDNGDCFVDTFYIRYTDGNDTLTKKIPTWYLRPLYVSLKSTTELK